MGKHGQTIGSTIKEESLLQVTTHTHTPDKTPSASSECWERRGLEGNV